MPPSGISPDSSVRNVSACVTNVAFCDGAALFGLGDGRILSLSRSGDETWTQAHGGAIHAMAVHRDRIFSGGDDGGLVVTRSGEATLLHRSRQGWVSDIRLTPDGSVVFTCARSVAVLRAPYERTDRTFDEHPSTLMGLALDPKGKRIAVAHYKGVTLWWLNSEAKQPKRLVWGGSHIAVTWSPNGKYVVSAMQENDLHVWRLADMMAMRMGGYQAKPRSMSWSADSRWLLTSGAPSLIGWDFSGAGPANRPGREYCDGGGAVVSLVACHPRRSFAAVGFSDGAVRLVDLKTGEERLLSRSRTAPVTALAWSENGASLAGGTEDGDCLLLNCKELA
jgi:WD40 repeat protein